MQLEELVTSRKLCEKLKELGYPQENSALYWDDAHNMSIYTHHEASEGSFISQCIAAPLAEELKGLLPISIEDEIGQEYQLIAKKLNYGWYLGYVQIDNLEEQYYWVVCNNLSNAFSNMLIWLVENGHVKFDKEVE